MVHSDLEAFVTSTQSRIRFRHHHEFKRTPKTRRVTEAYPGDRAWLTYFSDAVESQTALLQGRVALVEKYRETGIFFHQPRASRYTYPAKKVRTLSQSTSK